MQMWIVENPGHDSISQYMTYPEYLGKLNKFISNDRAYEPVMRKWHHRAVLMHKRLSFTSDYTNGYILDKRSVGITQNYRRENTSQKITNTI